MAFNEQSEKEFLPGSFVERFKNRGPCRKLLGNVTVLLAFVSTPQHPWTQKQIEEVYKVSYSSVRIMRKEAARYGAQLNMSYGELYFNVSSENINFQDLSWYNEILRKYYHTTRISDVYEKYRKSLMMDETPIIFLFNSWDRSYAHVARKDYPWWNEEFCVIFCDTNMHDNYLTHEVLHLFGAIDLYDYNNEGIQRAAKKYFPNSDMLTISHEIDELTAYLIGWTDELSDKSKQFIIETFGLR